MIVVGAANSAVQIAHELARVADVTIAVREELRFLPQRILGRDLHFWMKVTGFDALNLFPGRGTSVLDTGSYRAAIVAGRPGRPADVHGLPVRWRHLVRR